MMASSGCLATKNPIEGGAVSCWHELPQSGSIFSACYNPQPMAKQFTKWKKGLAKTSKAKFGQIAGLIGASEITDDTFEELEALMIQADLGVETSEAILSALWERERKEGLTKTHELRQALR